MLGQRLCGAGAAAFCKDQLQIEHLSHRQSKGAQGEMKAVMHKQGLAASVDAGFAHYDFLI